MPVPSASTALVCSSTALDLDILAQYTNAIKVQTKNEQHNRWLYHIVCPQSKDYDQWNHELIAVELHVKARCFQPLLDDGGRTNGKILLQPSFPSGFYPTETWTAPRKKRKISAEETIQVLLDALAAKDRLIKVQSALIATLQGQHCPVDSSTWTGHSQAKAPRSIQNSHSTNPSPCGGYIRY